MNKVNSKATLRWNVAESPSLSQAVKMRFTEKFAGRINQAGELVLSSERFRDQPRNVADCYEKLRHLIQSVLIAAPPRIKTRPTRGAVERRLEQKRLASRRKQQRHFRPDREL